MGKSKIKLITADVPKVDSISKNQIPKLLEQKNKKQIKINYPDELEKLKQSDHFKEISEINIDKQSFTNVLGVTLKYINYFSYYFDNDDELISNYMYAMITLNNEETQQSLPAFTQFLLDYFASDSMISKIDNMVEHNLTNSLVNEFNSKYDESLQLVRPHLKALMGMSILHRLIIPIISHYYKTNKKNLKDSSGKKMDARDFYFKCMLPFSGSFNKIYDIHLMNKLYLLATSRVSKTRRSEETMWDRKIRQGITHAYYINKLIVDMFVDISQKTVFKKSAISFYHVCIDKAIKYELWGQDEFDTVEMKMEYGENDDKLTRFEYIQMSNAVPNQNERIRGLAIIDDTIEMLSDKHDIDITDDMISFYRENLDIDDHQIDLIYQFISSYFDSSKTAKLMQNTRLFKLIILMKYELEERNYKYLPHIISGKYNREMSRRFNRTTIEKYIRNHSLFESISEKYSDAEGEIDMKDLVNTVNKFISSPLYIVDYDHRDELGTQINMDEDVVIDELMRMVNDL